MTQSSFHHENIFHTYHHAIDNLSSYLNRLNELTTLKEKYKNVDAQKYSAACWSIGQVEKSLQKAYQDALIITGQYLTHCMSQGGC